METRQRSEVTVPGAETSLLLLLWVSAQSCSLGPAFPSPVPGWTRVGRIRSRGEISFETFRGTEVPAGGGQNTQVGWNICAEKADSSSSGNHLGFYIFTSQPISQGHAGLCYYLFHSQQLAATDYVPGLCRQADLLTTSISPSSEGHGVSPRPVHHSPQLALGMKETRSLCLRQSMSASAISVDNCRWSNLFPDRKAPRGSA